MPNKIQKKHTQLAALEDALKERMAANGDTQEDVARKSGVSQSDISRILGGQRKRLGKSARKLCQYACIELRLSSQSSTARELLSHTLHRAVGDNAAAMLALAQVVESLIPILKGIQGSASGDIPGATNDNPLSQ